MRRPKISALLSTFVFISSFALCQGYEDTLYKVDGSSIECKVLGFRGDSLVLFEYVYLRGNKKSFVSTQLNASELISIEYSGLIYPVVDGKIQMVFNPSQSAGEYLSRGAGNLMTSSLIGIVSAVGAGFIAKSSPNAAIAIGGGGGLTSIILYFSGLSKFKKSGQKLKNLESQASE